MTNPSIARCISYRFLLRTAVVLASFVVLFSTLASAASNPTWLRIILDNAPTPRCDGAMAYDPVSKKLVLFGGFDATHQLGDTWVFDGAKWTDVTTAVAPTPRASATMAFDSVTGQLVLFGGFDGANYLNDTWLWDGATSTWTPASPDAAPPAIAGASLFTDPANGHVDIFGGFSKTVHYQASVWQWSGSTWNQIPVPKEPSGRAWSQAVYDPIRKNVVIFGGVGEVNPTNTWTFDGSAWTEKNPSLSPPTTMFAGAAFDPVLGQAVLFGGWGGTKGTDLNSTWAWDGSNWTALKPIHSPTAREFVYEAYDPASHQLILFGGLEIVPQVLLNGTWKLVMR